MQTQEQAILKHLKAGHAIDPLMALRKFGCFRLGARIFDLRQAGHKILTTHKRVNSRNGHGAVIALYKLEA